MSTSSAYLSSYRANRVFDISVTTDNDGNFKASGEIDLPPVPIRNLDVKARLFDTDQVRIDVTIDIDATDGSPSNDPKRITVFGGGDNWGEWVYCGKFKINFGGEKFHYEISGTTTPPTLNTLLKFQIMVW